MRKMMYTVALNLPDDSTAEHTLRVTGGDRLKAELEAAKLRLPEPSAAPQNTTALWVWCALQREGHLARSVSFVQFREDMLDDFAIAAGHPLTEGEYPADPTQPAASAEPDSSSPATTETPATGSTPS